MRRILPKHTSRGQGQLPSSSEMSPKTLSGIKKKITKTLNKFESPKRSDKEKVELAIGVLTTLHAEKSLESSADLLADFLPDGLSISQTKHTDGTFKLTLSSNNSTDKPILTFVGKKEPHQTQFTGKVIIPSQNSPSGKTHYSVKFQASSSKKTSFLSSSKSKPSVAHLPLEDTLASGGSPQTGRDFVEDLIFKSLPELTTVEMGSNGYSRNQVDTINALTHRYEEGSNHYHFILGAEVLTVFKDDNGGITHMQLETHDQPVQRFTCTENGGETTFEKEVKPSMQENAEKFFSRLEVKSGGDVARGIKGAADSHTTPSIMVLDRKTKVFKPEKGRKPRGFKPSEGSKKAVGYKSEGTFYIFDGEGFPLKGEQTVVLSDEPLKSTYTGTFDETGAIQDGIITRGEGDDKTIELYEKGQSLFPAARPERYELQLKLQSGDEDLELILSEYKASIQDKTPADLFDTFVQGLSIEPNTQEGGVSLSVLDSFGLLNTDGVNLLLNADLSGIADTLKSSVTSKLLTVESSELEAVIQDFTSLEALLENCLPEVRKSEYSLGIDYPDVFETGLAETGQVTSAYQQVFSNYQEFMKLDQFEGPETLFQTFVSNADPEAMTAPKVAVIKSFIANLDESTLQTVSDLGVSDVDLYSAVYSAINADNPLGAMSDTLDPMVEAFTQSLGAIKETQKESLSTLFQTINNLNQRSQGTQVLDSWLQKLEDPIVEPEPAVVPNPPPRIIPKADIPNDSGIISDMETEEESIQPEPDKIIVSDTPSESGSIGAVDADVQVEPDTPLIIDGLTVTTAENSKGLVIHTFTDDKGGIVKKFSGELDEGVPTGKGILQFYEGSEVSRSLGANFTKGSSRVMGTLVFQPKGGLKQTIKGEFDAKTGKPIEGETYNVTYKGANTKIVFKGEVDTNGVPKREGIFVTYPIPQVKPQASYAVHVQSTQNGVSNCRLMLSPNTEQSFRLTIQLDESVKPPFELKDIIAYLKNDPSQSLALAMVQHHHSHIGHSEPSSEPSPFEKLMDAIGLKVDTQLSQSDIENAGLDTGEFLSLVKDSPDSQPSEALAKHLIVSACTLHSTKGLETIQSSSSKVIDYFVENSEFSGTDDDLEAATPAAKLATFKSFLTPENLAALSKYGLNTPGFMSKIYSGILSSDSLMPLESDLKAIAQSADPESSNDLIDLLKNIYALTLDVNDGFGLDSIVLDGLIEIIEQGSSEV